MNPLTHRVACWQGRAVGIVPQKLERVLPEAARAAAAAQVAPPAPPTPRIRGCGCRFLLRDVSQCHHPVSHCCRCLSRSARPLWRGWRSVLHAAAAAQPPSAPDDPLRYLSLRQVRRPPSPRPPPKRL
jgi:hypothetical protein